MDWTDTKFAGRKYSDTRKYRRRRPSKYAGLPMNYLAVFGASYFEGKVGIGDDESNREVGCGGRKCKNIKLA